MKRISSLLTCVASIMLFAGSYAQTNPTAASLPFSLNSQSSGTLPGGVAVHRFSSIQTSRTLSPANGGDLPNQGSSPAGTAGGWYNLGTDGIGLLASGTNPAGAVIVAINTTGLSSISVSWICKTIKNQASRDNSIALQYRVGTSGNFTDVGNSTTYSSTGTADGNTSSVFTETLPSGANNQSVVQVRWIYWESVSTSGSRDKISVDNISISATSSGTCSAPTGLAAANITTSSATFSWNAVSGASSYEYALSTSSTAPGSGTNTAATSYTATGLSASTIYYFYVRTNCGGGQFSGWTSVSFTTGASESDPEFVVMTYNLLNYPGTNAATRDSSFRTVLDSVQPDVLVVQELSSTSGVSDFLNNVLNYSSSAYSQGTFINGPDTDNGLYYKSTKFQFISNTPIQTDLRDINEFMLKYLPSGDTLIIFSAHLKASSASSDEAQRALEVDSLRKVTDALAGGKYFMVCGDFNIYGSTESAYQKLTGNGNNANGKFNDLLTMTGTWNNSSYAVNHTQSPRTTAFGGGATGGLDDRFDMLLFSDAIIQTGGIDVVSNSYKAYGNDGAHYNQALNTPPYTMYSSVTAAALHNASDHLPVVVKLKHTSGAKSAAVTGIANNGDRTMDKVSVFPNPARNTLFVKTNSAFNASAQFFLYDLTGRMLQQAALSGSVNETQSLDISGLPAGVYTYKIISMGEKSQDGKILINRN